MKITFNFIIPSVGYLCCMALIIVDVYYGGLMNYLIVIGSERHSSFGHYDNFLIMQSFGFVMFGIIWINMIISYAIVLVGNFIYKTAA